MENLYNRDMLTNLYNRHGYEMFFTKIFKECCEKGVPIGVMMIDMDDLKLTNDNYGHAEGDYSLTTIADGMRLAALHNEVCLRTGGDEFVVLAKDYSEEKASIYVKSLCDYIEKCVQRDKKVYPLSVSTGVCIKIPPKEASEDQDAIRSFSEEYLRIADAKMYEVKKQHKAGRS